MRRFALLIPLVIATASYAQHRHMETATLVPSDSVVQLSREFILHHSESLILDNGTSLRAGLDYTLSYRSGTVHLSRTLRDTLFAGMPARTVTILYRFIPVSFDRVYALRSVETTPDSAGRTMTRFPPADPAPFRMDDLFAPSLQKSGSLSRGFNIGTNQDLSLSSGFRMQLAGQLSREIDVVAVLTDENTPLQPEGTTETLQEVDKVFVEVRHPSAWATLGDFHEEIDGREGGVFGTLNRKLQGAKGTVNLSPGAANDLSGSVTLSGGGARGKYSTNEFRGREGNQGPYRLTGSRGEHQIIVIAGSERVHVDGVLMKRGEVNDYTIDYSSAAITFTPRRLITNASRIVVDFEFTDRQYDRNFLSARSSVSSFGGSLRVSTMFLQETDDPDSPREATLSGDTRQIVEDAGDDELRSSVSGIRFVGRDTLTGKPLGVYLLRDTTIGTQTVRIAVYAPGDTNSVYAVTFSPVQTMPPDSAGYERVGLGHFRFAGLGLGTHLPLAVIALPSAHRFANVHAELAVSENLVIGAELAGSRFDQNRLSPHDDEDNGGGAYRFSMKFNPRRMTIAGLEMGAIDVRYNERFRGGRFVAPGRFDEVEFTRRWGSEMANPGDERIREGSALLTPVQGVALRGGYGSYRLGSDFRSSRSEAELSVGDSTDAAARYGLEHISASDQRRSLGTAWLRQNGSAVIQWGTLRPSLAFQAEDRDMKPASGDTLLEGSFRFTQWTPTLLLSDFHGMTASAEVGLRQVDSALTGALQPSFRATTWTLSWTLKEWNGLRASVSFAAKSTRFESAFKARGNGDSDVRAVRSVLQYAPPRRGIETDLYYEFSNQRSARLERVYVRVARGEGNYRYLGDLNGNAIADDNEFELTRFDGEYIVVFLPGEILYPVADVKASVRLRLRPAQILEGPGGFWSWLSALSSETYLRVDERSSDPETDNVAFLHLGTFRKDPHTIAGSQIVTQDIHVFEYDPGFSLRFRVSERKSFVQLVTASERSTIRERSIRVRTQPLTEWGNESEISWRADRVLGTRPGPRDRDLHSLGFTSDLAYRPEPDWEIGFRLSLETIRDEYGGDDATADLNEQSVRIVRAFPGAGQVRAELTREETTLSNASAVSGRTYPFEFTKGRLFGRSLLWMIGADYRFTGNIQLSLLYTGRSEGGRPPVHTARAEARAFF